MQCHIWRKPPASRHQAAHKTSVGPSEDKICLAVLQESGKPRSEEVLLTVPLCLRVGAVWSHGHPFSSEGSWGLPSTIPTSEAR